MDFLERLRPCGAFAGGDARGPSKSLERSHSTAQFSLNQLTTLISLRAAHPGITKDQ